MGTSVTVVLIGTKTNTRKWVKYEIKKSYERGNGIVGIYIHNMKDSNGDTDTKGSNKFGAIGQDVNGNSVYFFQLYKTYDWVNGNGYNNLGKWIKEAAKNAEK